MNGAVRNAAYGGSRTASSSSSAAGREWRSGVEGETADPYLPDQPPPHPPPQAGSFLLANILFCSEDSHECMSADGASLWRRIQKPIAFTLCCVGCLVYALSAVSVLRSGRCEGGRGK